MDFNYEKAIENSEYIPTYRDDIELEEQEERFTIDTPEKADWAIEKIKERNKRAELYISACNAKIADLEIKIIEKERRTQEKNAFLEHALIEYMKTVPTKKAKNSESLELPSGIIRLKNPTFKFERQEDKLIYELKGTEYVENVPKLKWGEFKKILDNVNGVVIRTDTGEQVNGVEIIEVEERIEVK